MVNKQISEASEVLYIKDYRKYIVERVFSNDYKIYFANIRDLETKILYSNIILDDLEPIIMPEKIEIDVELELDDNLENDNSNLTNELSEETKKKLRKLLHE